MKGNQKFYICETCGSIIGLVENKGIPVVCCGKEMGELAANTTEAATEKHIPVVEAKGDIIEVKIGSMPHPMEDAHNIVFVYVQTENGGQRKALKPGSDAAVSFSFINDKPIAVYAYCNLHGLWKTDL